MGLDLNLVSISPVNSVDFIKNVFRLYEQEQLFVVMDEAAKPSSLAELSVVKHLVPAQDFGWLSIAHELSVNDSPAQILLSSGTEGEPKAIAISYANLSNTTQRLIEVMQLDDSIREYVGIPAYHSFGLGRCRAVSAAGGQLYIPENGFNVREIARMLESGEINSVSAVPSLWRILLTQATLFKDIGKNLRWIEIGSQYMSAEEKLKLKTLFPNAIIVQHYGLTEASRSTFLRIHSANASDLESVGPVSEQVQVKIQNDRICLKGPNVALGLVKGDMISPITDEDGWFVTSDQGHISNDHLYFDGRADDVINYSGIKVSPEKLEQSLKLKLPQLQDFCVVGASDKLSGERFVVFVLEGTVLAEADVVKALDDILQEQGIRAKSAIDVVTIASFPKTATGKIKRKQLRKSYVEKRRPANEGIDKKGGSVEAIFGEFFKNETVTPSSTFSSLGGDSLNYVQMSVLLEELIGQLPSGWENIPIGQLSTYSAKNASGVLKTLDIATVLRALAITFVVIIHSGFSFLSGATTVLIMLVGYNFSRFQSVNINKGHIWPSIAKYLVRILLPFYMILISYYLLRGDPQWSVLLLYGNISGYEWSGLIPEWFILNMVQILLVIGILFSFSPIRTLYLSNPTIFSASFLVILVAGHLLLSLFLEGGLKFNMPYNYLPVFWLGWCLNCLDRRFLLLLLGASVIEAYLQVGGEKWFWLLFGAVVLFYVKEVKIPHLGKLVVTTIASATYYIFIFNEAIIKVAEQISVLDTFAIKFLLAMLLSMGAWYFFEQVVPAILKKLQVKLIRSANSSGG